MGRGPALGILVMIGAMVGFTLRDVAAKFLVLDVTPVQIIWIQFTFSFLLLAAVTYPRHGLRAFMPTPEVLQFWRGVTAVGGTGFYYWALYYLPLVDVAAVVLIAPLVVTALAPVLLGEKIGLQRTLAVVVGFSGVLLILRPGFSGSLTGYFIALAAGIFFGLNYICNRKLGTLHPPLVNVAHNLIFGAVMLAPATFILWVDIPVAQFFMFSLFLAAGLAAHFCLVNAFRYGPANVIAPFQYSIIITATVGSYVFFGTVPGLLTYAGAAIVIGAGLFIGLREAHAARRKAAESQPQPLAEPAPDPILQARSSVLSRSQT